MVVGLSSVFAFLGLLVVVMYASAWFFNTFSHLFPDPDSQVSTAAPPDLSDIAVVLAALRSRTR